MSAEQLPASDWWVYVLQCADNSLYTGIAKDVAKRLQEHNESPRAAKYTRARRPVQLVYVEVVAGRSEALKREMAIKALKRIEKQGLIAATREATQRYANRLEIPLLAKCG